jgi:hypothetical protein
MESVDRFRLNFNLMHIWFMDCIVNNLFFNPGPFSIGTRPNDGFLGNVSFLDRLT